MGHERIGVLPRSKPWRQVLREIETFDGSEEKASDIAKSTIKNVRDRIKDIQYDDNVRSAFQFLVGLAVAARTNNPETYLKEIDLILPASPTHLHLV